MVGGVSRALWERERRAIRMQVNPSRPETYGIDPEQVRTALSANSASLSSGTPLWRRARLFAPDQQPADQRRAVLQLRRPLAGPGTAELVSDRRCDRQLEPRQKPILDQRMC